MRLSWVDVFTDRPGAGNPLAVVMDADALDRRAMQALARELGLSETVFTLDGDRALRIFTPATELPLAGHPVVGAAVELSRLRRIPARGMHVFRTPSGEMEVELADGTATMRQLKPVYGPELERDVVARLLGVEVVGAPVMCTTTGVKQAFARVRGRAELGMVKPDLAGIAALDGVDGVVAWCEAGSVVAQRFFAPQLGVDEDPATGSAAGALAALRVFEGAAPGRITVEQGGEIGRPSTIEVSVGGDRGAPGDVRVAGTAALVLEAEISADVLARLA
jgi:trans-2,3-dihydro-3-hydroxyanthranilate isomerase